RRRGDRCAGRMDHRRPPDSNAHARRSRVTRDDATLVVAAGGRMSMDARATAAPIRRRLIVLVPLILFLALAALFFFRLGAGDPSRIASALIGHPAPQTELPPVAGLQRDGKPVPGLSAAAFKGTVTLLNVWASWCVPCHDEAPLLMQLAEDPRIRVAGINYKDQPEDARRFLGRYGNPFASAAARRTYLA